MTSSIECLAAITFISKISVLEHEFTWGNIDILVVANVEAI